MVSDKIKSISIIVIVAMIVITLGMYSYNKYVDLKYKATSLASPCELCCKYNENYQCQSIIKNVNSLPLDSELLKNLSG
jgi:hypothetical protein